MGTVIRPEITKKNKYWIEKHRYYELKHFCLQYPIWRKAYAALDGLTSQVTRRQNVLKRNRFTLNEWDYWKKLQKKHQPISVVIF